VNGKLTPIQRGCLILPLKYIVKMDIGILVLITGNIPVHYGVFICRLTRIVHMGKLQIGNGYQENVTKGH